MTFLVFIIAVFDAPSIRSFKRFVADAVNPG